MKKTIEQFTTEALRPLLNEMSEMNWGDARVYGDWLAQTYYHICHSTRLLAAAGSRFHMDQDAFHIQCMRHSGEEKSHEKLALSDLKEMKLGLGDFPELPGTKALYRSNYFQIERESPLAIFGYAYFLERLAVEAGTPMEAAAQKAFGSRAVKHLHVHTKEDVDHIKGYAHMLEAFRGADRHWVEQAVLSTSDNYRWMVQSIRARAQLSKSRAA